MAFELMKEIKKLCKGCIDDEDWCIFIVAAILGFLICTYMKTDNFTNFAALDEAYSGPIVKSDQGESTVLGLKPKVRTATEPPPSLKHQVESVRKLPSYSSQKLNQSPGIISKDASIFMPFDEVWHAGYAPVNYMLEGGQQLPIDKKGPFGPDRPMEGPSQVVEKAQPGSGTNELSIVLIYAPWCGHSKRMIPDYEKIKGEFHGKTIGSTKVNIIMYNSDVDKDKVKEYGVKGFPTLFVEKNGKRHPFNSRKYGEIKEYILKEAK